MKKQIKAVFTSESNAHHAVDLLKEQIPIISVRTDVTNPIPSYQPAIEFGGAIDSPLQIKEDPTVPFATSPSIVTESKATVNIKTDEEFCQTAVKLFTNEGAHSIDVQS